MSLLLPYLIFGILLLLTSSVMLATVLFNKRIRDKYNVFSVKFGVDMLTAICLIVVGSLNRREEIQCNAALVISASIPFVQALLLIAEVTDWWLAAFSPVYFHNSSLACRFLPFIIGIIFCVIIMTILVVFDVIHHENISCVDSPGGTFIMLAYDISLIMITLCLAALAILLLNHLHTVYYIPIMFHFIATLLLQEISLISVILFTGHDGVILASDITNFLVTVHSLAHTAFFIYRHEDYRQTVISMAYKPTRDEGL